LVLTLTRRASSGRRAPLPASASPRSRLRKTSTCRIRVLFGFVGSGSTDQRRMYIVPCGGEPPPLNTQPFGLMSPPRPSVFAPSEPEGDGVSPVPLPPDGAGHPACVPTAVRSVLVSVSGR